MARYFFQLENGRIVRDSRGSEHPHLHDARVQAVRALAEIIDEKRESFWDDQPVRVVVSDEAGRKLFVIEASAHAVQ
jgi:hypothetical protein